MNGDLAFKIKIPAKTIDKLVKIIKKFYVTLLLLDDNSINYILIT